jgi:putative acetyltransferase
MPMLRTEQPTDVPAIRAVLEAAFGQPGEAKLVEALREAGRLMVSLVAEQAGGVVGHVAFSRVKVADCESGVGLAPLAVLPAWQRRGIGAALVREGLAACRQCGAGFVVVLGDPAYYGRFGFEAAANFGLSDEYGGGPAFQVLELVAGSIPKTGGLVRYAPEFAIVAE